MTPEILLREVVTPGLCFLAYAIGPKPADGLDVRVLMLAIAGQEGNWRDRVQIGGPARSLWQFESGGGVKGVLGHSTAGPWVRAVCAALDIPPSIATVYDAMAWNDHLAVAMSRLLLWTSPAPIPAMSDVQAGWHYYESLWRPGKPGPDRWANNHAMATAAVKGAMS